VELFYFGMAIGSLRCFGAVFSTLKAPQQCGAFLFRHGHRFAPMLRSGILHFKSSTAMWSFFISAWPSVRSDASERYSPLNYRGQRKLAFFSLNKLSRGYWFAFQSRQLCLASYIELTDIYCLLRCQFFRLKLSTFYFFLARAWILIEKVQLN
jgi:hypothetical protein